MDKRQLIIEIHQFNTTVDDQFLEQFDKDALAQYLQHLKDAATGSKRIAGWVKNEKPVRLAS